MILCKILILNHRSHISSVQKIEVLSSFFQSKSLSSCSTVFHFLMVEGVSMSVTLEIRMLYISLDPLEFLQIISTKLGWRGNSFFGLVRPFFFVRKRSHWSNDVIICPCYRGHTPSGSHSMEAVEDGLKYLGLRWWVAAFWEMHVSPAKHSYAWLPRQCDYRTDTQTERQTPEKVIPMCRYALKVTQKLS